MSHESELNKVVWKQMIEMPYYGIGSNMYWGVVSPFGKEYGFIVMQNVQNIEPPHFPHVMIH